ncbi:MAG: phosphoribosylglycinamide formyltransferase [Thermoplasmataceae archaeon]
MALMQTIVVLASGNGSNFQAISDAIKSGEVDAKIVLLISDRRDAYVLQRATAEGIPSKTFHHDRSNPELFFRKIRQEIESANPDLIVLAGFNRILPYWVIDGYRAINLHPALLPLFGGKGFYGMKVHEAVIKSGARFSGCTVHFVTEEVDGGPIIVQRMVDVLDDDTPESLAERIHREEHIAIISAMKIVLSGKYRIDGKRVRYSQIQP